MDNQPTSAKPRVLPPVSPTTTASRASSVSLADFSEALSTGVLRAMSTSRAIDTSDVELEKPEYFSRWAWAGWIIGDGPWGPRRGDGPIEGAGKEVGR